MHALAQKERVPYRIARGELDGKMKCRIWRKLHAEEARRFDDAYALVAKTPDIDLADAFGILQSGMTPDEFKLRKEKAQKKMAVKQARTQVGNDAVEGFIRALWEKKVETSVVLAERTFLDVLSGVEPIAFAFEKAGRIEKIHVVAMANRQVWEKTLPHVGRDAKLTQKPAPVSRQPEKRPFSDPRPFVEAVGQDVSLLLRNGIRLTAPLRAVGPYDLLLGSEEETIFIPIHAILEWSH